MRYLSDTEVAATLAAMERFPGNITAQARDLGIPRGTMRGRAAAILSGRYLSVQNGQGVVDPAGSPPAIPQEIAHHTDEQAQDEDFSGIHSSRLRIRVKAGDGVVHKVVCIGDHHDKPDRDKTRALLIGRFIEHQRPSAVVSIGDWASLDSLSNHEAPGSAGDHNRADFPSELDSLWESLELLGKGMGRFRCPLFQTHGNHEERAWKKAEAAPKHAGDFPHRLEQVFKRQHWQTRRFGEFLDLYGVDFVHVPLNVMGKPMGGQFVERNIAALTGRSTVIGHTHRAGVHNFGRIGQNRSVTVVNLGTSLPHGMVERYSGLSQTGWSYGVFVLRIANGQILSAKHYDMLEIGEQYG